LLACPHATGLRPSGGLPRRLPAAGCSSTASRSGRPGGSPGRDRSGWRHPS
jgi:hypothetical protein